MITLESNDGQQFLVDQAAAYMSDLVRNTVEDVGQTDEPIILPNVRGAVLAKVVEYCIHHKDDARILSSTPDLIQSDRAIDAWDRRFMDIDDALMLEILSTADYLSIEPLVDLGCTVIAKIIRSMSVDEIRQRYGVDDDFTEDQRRQVQRELSQLQ